jgi:hypothetical protein
MNIILGLARKQYFGSVHESKDPTGRNLRHKEEILQDPNNCSRFERPRQALFIA